MKVFLSHARKDGELARALGAALKREGFTVWDDELEITPGENWARKVAKALDDSDLMVILLTPGAMDSDALRQNIEFAIANRKYAHRVFSVLVGQKMPAGKNVPWILLKLPHSRLTSVDELPRAVSDIQNLMGEAHARGIPFPRQSRLRKGATTTRIPRPASNSSLVQSSPHSRRRTMAG
jgi:hypothetical protein